MESSSKPFDVFYLSLRDCAIEKCNPNGTDDETASKLWEVSAELVGLAEKKTQQDETGDDNVIVAWRCPTYMPEYKWEVILPNYNPLHANGSVT